MSKPDHIIIYCDGACSGNQFGTNRGGWGAVLLFQGQRKEIFGGEKNTTNQRMELTACIRALESLKRTDLPVIIHSDSAYLVNCMQQKWYEKWERNGWKNVKKQPVENRDLWERLLQLVSKYQISFRKVEGHVGIELNERADRLARRAAEKK
ncbi:MAG: ribonuclease HI [Bacteroidota bacterium]|nr:ribonuclease HI [Bacteroidota bacterium]